MASSSEIFSEWGRISEVDPLALSNLNESFFWKVGDKGGKACWLLETTPKLELRFMGESCEPPAGSCVVKLEDRVLRNLYSNNLSPQEAFLGGELKIFGSLSQALKLNLVFELFCGGA